MNETHTEKKGRGLGTLGLVLLIALLFFGVKFIFAGLEAMMPPPEPNPFTTLTGESGQPASYGLRLLTQEELQDRDILGWLDSDREWMEGGGASREADVFLLYRQDSDEYVLYLPDQDRALTAADLTADEEEDGDGEITLVLRARTPEGSETVAPEGQLLAFQTRSQVWRGIRVQVILDGRERHVNKLASIGGWLYSTEEVYIGREIGG